MKYLRTFVAAAAMVFLMTTTTAAAPLPVGDNACSQCHAGAGDAWCAGLILYTVASCCGNQNQTAWAWCVNYEWGFYVDCQTPQSFECQCDEWGNGCQRLGGEHPKEKEY